MLADRRVWRGVLPGLAHLDCTRVELPSHGQAPAWNGGDYQTQAYELLASQIDAPAHLTAHSFGATVALRYAVEHPEHLASLTLIEPVFFHAARQVCQSEYAAYETRAAPIMAEIRAGDLHHAAEMFLAAWGVPGAWGTLPDAAQAAIAAQMPLIEVTAPSLVEDTGRIWPRLERITAPVKLITGARSEPVMAAIAQGLAEVMALEAHVIEEAGHMIPVTHSPALAAIL